MLKYTVLPTDIVRAYQIGGADAFGHPPERTRSDDDGNPCRHCLKEIPAGAEMLILAHKPFEGAHPYSEIGPIFLCADACPQGGGTEVPDILRTAPDYLLKGYSPAGRIVYGTGGVVTAADLPRQAETILAHHGVAYVHVRSARNNCYQLRIDPMT